MDSAAGLKNARLGVIAKTRRAQAAAEVEKLRSAVADVEARLQAAQDKYEQQVQLHAADLQAMARRRDRLQAVEQDLLTTQARGATSEAERRGPRH